MAKRKASPAKVGIQPEQKVLGQRVVRNEDARLLTGRALFIDDLQLPGTVHVAFVRSPYAHARINGIDTSFARDFDGVLAVVTAEDLGDYWQPGPLLVPPPPVPGMTFHERTQVPLAKDKVRLVGEAVVAVVATSRALAEARSRSASRSAARRLSISPSRSASWASATS